MYQVLDFIRMALTHADPATIPSGAMLPLQKSECGAEPWHYLYGTTRHKTTGSLLNDRFDGYYKSHGYSRAQYDSLTAGWKPTDYATDCQGLLDAYLTYEKGEKTDINANMNYANWCADKGEIGAVDRPFVIGEAVFMARLNGSMHHVGWVCGFMPGGEPLIVEARGIAYGVVVTSFNSRPWTHRGLMTSKFDYSEEDTMPIILKKTSPMIQGEHIRSLQAALNALGYTDSSGKKLSEDGKCGTHTMEAVRAFATAHAETGATMPPVIGRLDLEAYGLTVGVFRLEDMQGGES